MIIVFALEISIPVYIGNCRYVIVYNIDLAASCDLPGDCFPDSLITVLHDISLDRQTVLWSLLQNAHIADPRKAHVQCPGDRSCRQCEDIHILAHFLDLFLVGHAEALLLIDDEKAQVFKLHILGQQPVGPDDDIHHPGFQAFDGFIHLRFCAETAQQADLHRIVLHPLGKCVVVLLGKDRCRHQHGDLAAFGHWGLAAVMWGLYLIFAVGSTILGAREWKGSGWMALAPFLFLILHVSYGVGTILGLIGGRAYVPS